MLIERPLATLLLAGLAALAINGGCSSSADVTAPGSTPPTAATPSIPGSPGPIPGTSEPATETTDSSLDPAFCAAAADYIIALDEISALRRSGRPVAWVTAFKQLSAAGRELGASLPTEVPADVEAALTTQTASLAGLVAEGSSEASPSAEQLRDFDAASVVVADYLTAQCPDVQPPAN